MKSKTFPTPPSIRYYFVDEAGDDALFDRKGHVITGQEGCSRFFILGFIDIPDTERINRSLSELRRKIFFPCSAPNLIFASSQ